MLFYVQIFQDQASYGTSGPASSVSLPRHKFELPLYITEMMNTAM